MKAKVPEARWTVYRAMVPGHEVVAEHVWATTEGAACTRGRFKFAKGDKILMSKIPFEDLYAVREEAKTSTRSKQPKHVEQRLPF